MKSAWCREQAGRVVLRLHIQPRAATTAVAGVHGDRLKVRVAAPPADGAANAILCRWLAEEFGVAASRVEILHGAAGRHKQVAVESPRRRPPWLGTC